MLECDCNKNRSDREVVEHPTASVGIIRITYDTQASACHYVITSLALFRICFNNDPSFYVLGVLS